MTQRPDLLRDLGEFIREQRSGARLSLRRLSELAGISNPYLSQIERGLRRPSADILQQIARALRISAETLYVRAGMLDERTPTADLEAAIADEPDLSDEQKQTLIHIYRSFLLAGGDDHRAPDAVGSAVARPPRPPRPAGRAHDGPGADLAGAPPPTAGVDMDIPTATEA